MRSATRLTAAAAVALLAAGCSARRPPPAVPGGVERGLASWYGGKFHGRPTASGEIFDQDGLTAAHRKLPLGTVIEVRHLGNGRTVRVRVNDRGPFIRGRILDLSRGAARALDMVREGVARVEIRILAPAPDPRRRTGAGAYTVQVGAFADRDRALDLKRRLDRAHRDVVVRAGGGLHRVQVGRFPSRAAAEAARRGLARQGLEALVVALDP